VTNAPSAGEPEPQWQQPSFSPQSEPKPSPVEAPVAFGSVLVRRGRVAPPSVAETVFATVGGVVWPVMIVLALMGVVGWWPAILTAILASAVLGNVRGHLKARRKALGRATTIPPEDKNRQR
jgi:hypothetical protein